MDRKDAHNRKGGRAERLEAALRDNLHRRKAQARARAALADSPAGAEGGPSGGRAPPRVAEDEREGT